MRSRILFFSGLIAFSAISIHAQKGVNSGTKFGHGQDSVRCVTNISLFEPYAKSGNFKDAKPFWEIAYNECPAATRNIYIYGVQIVKWEIEHEKDQVKKKALINKLMQIYDNRIKYFGEDSRYPKDWILGNKAVDYALVKGDNADNNLLYGWLKESVDGQKGNSNPQVVQLFVLTSEALFKKDAKNKEQYIQDYVKAAQFLDEYLSEAKGAMIDYTKQVKTMVDQSFAQSGAADCATLQALLAPKVEENKANLEFLKETIALLRKVKCNDIDVYFTASHYSHAIKPTSESAAGMAMQALKKDELDNATKYFEEASSLAEDKNDKADYQLTISKVYFKKRAYSKARQYAQNALELKPNQGEPYVLIAQMYAADAKNIYPNDPIMAQAVFYAAVDKLEKAKQVDPSIASDANSLISSYRQHFPKSEDIFMHSEISKGKTITIGGWIQEKTMVR